MNPRSEALLVVVVDHDADLQVSEVEGEVRLGGNKFRRCKYSRLRFPAEEVAQVHVVDTLIIGTVIE